MTTFAPWLIFASTLIIFLLGAAHLVLTFRGQLLHPHDAELEAQMRVISPNLTRETTMWRAWIGFNASHSFGALLFSLIYGYFALTQAAFLIQSPFLLTVGLVLLLGYALLAKLYWFSVPLRGIVLATVFYVVALGMIWGS